MNNERFKQKMAELEKELDAHIARLTPEGQQEYKQKKTEYNQEEAEVNNNFASSYNTDKPAKKTWTKNL